MKARCWLQCPVAVLLSLVVSFTVMIVELGMVAVVDMFMLEGVGGGVSPW